MHAITQHALKHILGIMQKKKKKGSENETFKVLPAKIS